MVNYTKETAVAQRQSGRSPVVRRGLRVTIVSLLLTLGFAPVAVSAAAAVDRGSFYEAVDGIAYRFMITPLGVRSYQVPTAAPVYKVVDASSDGSLLLYRVLRDGLPTGELRIENLESQESRQVTDEVVINASLSPDESRVAFVFTVGTAFGLAVTPVDAAKPDVLVDKDVAGTFVEWTADGAGVLFYKVHGEPRPGPDVSGHDLEGTEVDIFTPASIDLGTREITPVKDADSSIAMMARITDAADKTVQTSALFEIDAPDGQHRLGSTVPYGYGPLVVSEVGTNIRTSLGTGILVRVTHAGIVVRRVLANGSALEFTTWDGHTTELGTTTVVNYNFPMPNARVTQVGQNFDGGCFLGGPVANHTTASGLGWAYDIQSSTIGAHVLASAPGLVVRSVSTVTCNAVDTAGCGDYSSNCSSNGGWGNGIIIEHADGTWTKSTHGEHGSVQVTSGNVCQGQYVMRQGHTGNTAGGHGSTGNRCGDHTHWQRQGTAEWNGGSIEVAFADQSASPLSCNQIYTSGSVEGPCAAPTGEFTTSVTPTSRTITQGTTTNYVVTITSVGGFSGNVNLAALNLPPGYVVSGTYWSPSATVAVPANGSVSATLYIATGSGTSIGAFSTILRATSGSIVKDQTVTTTINPGTTPSFTTSVTPTSRTITQGTTTSYVVTITSVGGFSGNVNLAALNLPPGYVVSGTYWSPSATVAVPANGSVSATLYIATGSGTSIGAFSTVLRATSGSIVKDQTVTTTINPGTSTPTISGYTWDRTPVHSQPFNGTITGTNFISGATTVYFCQTSSSTCYAHPSAGVVVNSSTSISVSSVVLGTGSWQLVVQTSAGSSARSNPFTVQ